MHVPIGLLRSQISSDDEETKQISNLNNDERFWVSVKKFRDFFLSFTERFYSFFWFNSRFDWNAFEFDTFEEENFWKIAIILPFISFYIILFCKKRYTVDIVILWDVMFETLTWSKWTRKALFANAQKNRAKFSFLR